MNTNKLLERAVWVTPHVYALRGGCDKEPEAIASESKNDSGSAHTSDGHVTDEDEEEEGEAKNQPYIRRSRH
jgi:hypothetical protein